MKYLHIFLDIVRIFNLRKRKQKIYEINSFLNINFRFYTIFNMLIDNFIFI